MFDDETVQSACGQDALEYLRNKHRGGINGQKGTRYEDYYAVFRLAGYTGRAYSTGGGLGASETTRFISQVERCFVDDLVIEEMGRQQVLFHQLRNVQSLSWGDGEKSIAWNFESQETLSKRAERGYYCYLVVPDEGMQADLAASMPPTLKNFSEVHYFPWLETLDNYIQGWQEFHEAVASLSAFERPTAEKCLPVARGLLAAWIDAGPNALVLGEVLRELQSGSSYVRPIEGDRQLASEFIKALNGIEDLRWRQERGYFHCSAADGFESGTLPYNCHTHRFDLFVGWIAKQSPMCLDDLADGGWLA
jgi:hypothetical protein